MIGWAPAFAVITAASPTAPAPVMTIPSPARTSRTLRTAPAAVWNPHPRGPSSWRASPVYDNGVDNAVGGEGRLAERSAGNCGTVAVLEGSRSVERRSGEVSCQECAEIGRMAVAAVAANTTGVEAEDHMIADREGITDGLDDCVRAGLCAGHPGVSRRNPSRV